MQKLIDESMADVFKKGVSPEQVFFVFAVGFTVMGYLNIIFCVCEGLLMKKLRVYF